MMIIDDGENATTCTYFKQSDTHKKTDMKERSKERRDTIKQCGN